MQASNNQYGKLVKDIAQEEYPRGITMKRRKKGKGLLKPCEIVDMNNSRGV